MAFGFGNSGPTSSSASNMSTNLQTQTGPDLEDIQAESLGFLALSGDRKVRLLPTPWPSDNLPPPTSSLLSVASGIGLVAAAGPEVLVIASTNALRGQFTREGQSDGNPVAFDLQLKIPMQMRVCQVAFSAHENFLLISAETGGGLAIYDVAALMQGQTRSAFELSTNGASLRALTPNPVPEKADMFALVTTTGDLMMANLKERKLDTGPNGTVLKQGVSCVSWSAKGKQLIAGLGNGTAFQMTPEGEGKGEIPVPPGLDANHHVSSITWLGNDLFLIVHTPTAFDKTTAPDSIFHLVTGKQPGPYVFQKIADPCPPFGLNRSPPHHFLLRLRDFPPNLRDLLVVSSTASIDIGCLTRSESPLTSELPAEKITSVFTTTGMADDSRRPQMRMTEDMVDLSPIGMAMDLSSKDTVLRPIAGEEIENSPTPLPALMVLDHEGVVSAWWVVYSESIRQGTAYPGLAALKGENATVSTQQTVAFAKPAPQTASAFGKLAFGATSSTPQAPASSFGATNLSSTASPAFGANPALGNRASPWGTPSAGAAPRPGGATFGTPAFGSPTPVGMGAKTSAFGSTSPLGHQSSPLASQAQGTPPTSFGQTSGLGMRTGSVFGASPSNVADAKGESKAPATSASGGFGSYASQGGFAAAASTSNAGGSIFGMSSNNAPTASTGTPSIFGVPTAKQADKTTGGGLNGTGSKFSLVSTFKGDGTARDDDKMDKDGSGPPFSGLGSLLSEESPAFGAPRTTVDKAAETQALDGTEMDTESDRSESDPEDLEERRSLGGEGLSLDSGTPTLAKDQAARSLQSTNFKNANGGLFAQPDESASLTKKPTAESDKAPSLPPAPFPPSPKIKAEPPDEHDELSAVDKNIPEAPLPPDTVSKTTYAAGDSSTSSTSTNRPLVDDAPLPPDFVSSKAAAKPAEDAPLPPDFITAKEVPQGPKQVNEAGLPESEEDGGLDEEGSGVDVARDVSSMTDSGQSVRVTPQSSFGPSVDRSPLGGSFTQISRPLTTQSSRPLFGEIGSNSVPYLPPPSSRVHQSPRSPSPVRSAVPSAMLRSDQSRSFSAPGVPSHTSQPRKIMPNILNDSRPRPGAGTTEKSKGEAVPIPPKQVEEEDLSDKEDEKIREELATEVEGSTVLDPFIAHQDYVGHINKPGIPGQIERLYRDINSMIDTLGLNARSLKSFIKGHSESFGDGGRSLEDLEAEDDWCLIEIDDLTYLEDELAAELDHGRVKDVQGKLDTCTELWKNLIKVRAKHNDIKRVIDARTDPTHLAAIRSAPLSSEQMTQQYDIRRGYTSFQKLLGEAEESISLLKAKLASHHSSNGEVRGRPTPTVEAVMKTVQKMTSMAEQKSGDVDVLENQMRKLRMSSTDSLDGRASSPFATPPSTRSKPPRTPASSTHSLFYTPDSKRNSTRGLNSSTASSTGFSRSVTPRKHLGDIAPEDMRRATNKMDRRRQVSRKLRDALINAGPRVRTMDD